MSNINPIIIAAAAHKNSPLTPESAADIQIYLEFPNEQNWEIIHSLIIIGHTTLWQAILKVDEDFTQVGRTYRAREINEKTGELKGEGDEMMNDWPEIPKPEVVLRAIEAEIHLRN